LVGIQLAERRAASPEAGPAGKPGRPTARRLALPYNHDPGLVDLIEEHAPHVNDLYFAASPTVVASGRHRLDVVRPREFVSEIAGLVERIRPLGIKANVLVNPACLDDGYHDPTPILSHLSSLQEAGVSTVTVTDLNLAILIRRQLPELEISASTTALVNSAVKATLWRELCDVDDICPDRDVNKRPAALRAIRRAAPRARIRLLVNDHCLPDCALRMQCMNSIAHNSPTWAQSYLRWCLGIKHEQPWVIYSNSMLVPANLAYYEKRGLVDIVKIQGRQASSDYIAALARHYLTDSRVYDPFDLEEGHGLEEPEGVFETVSRCARNCHECNLEHAREQGFRNWCHYKYATATESENVGTLRALSAANGF
jgi:collagenase-like PrtC family protease